MNRIECVDVSKSFNCSFKKKAKLLNRIALLLTRKKPEEKTVLKNISLSVKEGEILGIIGRNGTGKTTLLRIITGILPDFTGKVITKGRITPLISLQVGLNGRLTLTENIFLVGSLMGMGQKEIQKKVVSIIQFAELESYENTKIFRFSQGMKVRLVISLALHTNPDIFLADEIFAMEDEYFKNKVKKEIKKRCKKGMSMILTSHQPEIIKTYCDKVIWIEQGVLKKQGDTNAIMKEYIRNEQ